MYAVPETDDQVEVCPHPTHEEVIHFGRRPICACVGEMLC